MDVPDSVHIIYIYIYLFIYLFKRLRATAGQGRNYVGPFCGYVGLCWPMLAYVGLCWPMLAYVGLCWPMLAYVGLSCGQRGPSLGYEAISWRATYLSVDVEALQMHKQHHVHMADRKGVRQPLNHCRDPKDPTKCKAHFPRTAWLTDTPLLIYRFPITAATHTRALWPALRWEDASLAVGQGGASKSGGTDRLRLRLPEQAAPHRGPGGQGVDEGSAAAVRRPKGKEVGLLGRQGREAFDHRLLRPRVVRGAVETCNLILKSGGQRPDRCRVHQERPGDRHQIPIKTPYPTKVSGTKMDAIDQFFPGHISRQGRPWNLFEIIIIDKS